MEDVKGRKRRVRKLGIGEAMMRMRIERMRVVRGFSLRYEGVKIVGWDQVNVGCGILCIDFIHSWLTSIQG